MPVSMHVTLRRSNRISSNPIRLQEEHANILLLQQEEIDLQRALQASELDLDLKDASDEDVSIVQHDSEDESKEDALVPSTESIWIKEIHSIRLPRFMADSGPQVALSDPLDLLQLFLPYSLLALIAQNTTAYAHSKGASSDWCTTPEELYRFIAVHICMGICVLPQVQLYWSEEYHIPFISQCFTRNRFMEILRYFHITPPDISSLNVPPLGKVQPLLDSLNQSFATFYKPGKELTVDEAMVGFKGRSAMKQYIPNKPTKWGYKVWCLSSNNYLLSFKVYEGAREGNASLSASDAVLHLVRPYQNHNRVLYMDRLFTSPELLTTLLENRTRGCGTVRFNQEGLPEKFKEKNPKMKKGTMKCWQKGEMGALLWKDRRLVRMLSTHISPKMTKRIRRRGHSKKERVPKVVLDYNQFKGGVDTVDQLRDNYSIGRKSLKWWPRLAWWCIDMCIVNAYSLHCMNSSVPLTHLQFRERLMHQLAEKYGQPCNEREEQRQRSSHGSQNHHKLIHSELERDCSLCSVQPTNRRETRYKCDICDIYLCVIPCYDIHRGENN